ncbi:MAG: hypothetical protein KDB23_21160, partial [Planctomycetales bacterium]|nr:hypothetical protein [Planctomycetales bacterium]
MPIQQLGGSRRLRAGLQSALAALWSADIARNPLDLAALEDRTLYSATPVMLDEVQVDTSEDAPQIELDLRSLFSLDNNGGTMQLSVAQNDHPGLFEHVAFGDQQQLLLDLAHNANGVADLLIRATNNAGAVELLPVHVDITSINDSPTAIDLQSVTVTDRSAGVTVIDLFAAFDDVEDADEDLTYRIAHNSNPELFSSIDFDLINGKLILHHAAGHTGTAELTIEATDTGNLSVGLGTNPDFNVYSKLGATGAGLDLPTIGVDEMTLWTSWNFFEYTAGAGYDFTHTDIEKLTRYLNNVPVGQGGVPLVFDIENDEFLNTPEGRDRFAEIVSLAKELRPDLDIGIYRMLPERN